MKSTKQTGLSVKAGVKAGGMRVNHSRRAAAIRVKSGMKAGAAIYLRNHSTALLSLN